MKIFVPNSGKLFSLCGGCSQLGAAENLVDDHTPKCRQCASLAVAGLALAAKTISVTSGGHRSGSVSPSTLSGEKEVGTCFFIPFWERTYDFGSTRENYRAESCFCHVGPGPLEFIGFTCFSNIFTVFCYFLLWFAIKRFVFR